MKPTTAQFRQKAKQTIADPKIQKNIGALYYGFHQARIEAGKETHNWEELRQKSRDIKAHTIENLDYFLDLAEQNITKAGGHVYFAKDAEEATKYVVSLALDRGVKTVIKGKSMLSEEMDLNRHLEDAGMEAVETDLGEYIIQLAQETPYHIIAPAIHKSRDDIRELFKKHLKDRPYEEIQDMAAEARVQLREKFISADMGITGANFVVAETGTVVLVTNEGNGRMCTSMPKIHVAITGMEKMVPSMQDLSILLRTLIRSATGQWLTSYVTTVTGPRKPDEVDGPDEFHLVIVDNGRSKLLADPKLRESLYCLRCGACLNACPVYRKVGGHSYGWVYPGPIGAVISPVMTGMSKAKDLPFASTLCGECKEVCPVKIDLPRMLLHHRNQLAEGEKISKFESWAMKGWKLLLSGPTALNWGHKIGRLLQWPFARAGFLKHLPPPLSGWTRHRWFPALAPKSFREIWNEKKGK